MNLWESAWLSSLSVFHSLSQNRIVKHLLYCFLYAMEHIEPWSRFLACNVLPYDTNIKHVFARLFTVGCRLFGELPVFKCIANKTRYRWLFFLVMLANRSDAQKKATSGVVARTFAFQANACRHYKSAGSSLGLGSNLWLFVFGVFWSLSPRVFSRYSGFLPSFIC